MTTAFAETKKYWEEKGRTEGESVGEAKVYALYEKLKNDGRMDDILNAISDESLREKLYKEYGLK